MPATRSSSPLRPGSPGGPARTPPRPQGRHGAFPAAGQRLLLVAVALLLAWVARAAVFGPHGYLALHRERVRYEQQFQQLRQLQAQNLQLHQHIRALKTSPEAIESIARKQLHLTKPGEVVYTY
ncbi:MAG: FtsB family cell division protein [Terriglobales bacterium]